MGKIAHKLHLYFGLGAALVLMIVGISGAAMSYEKEILRLCNKGSFEVPIQKEKLTLEQLVERFEQQKPMAKITALTVASEPNSSSVFTIASVMNRKGEKIYINPYTGDILPEVKGGSFFRFMENLHRRLTFGEVGKQIVGASTIILIVVVISGIIISLPRLKRGFWHAMKFNPQTSGRAFLYSMHAAVGLWVVPLYLLVSLTGLFWSYQWYNSTLFAMSGVEKPVRPAMQKQPSEQKWESKKRPAVQEQNLKEGEASHAKAIQNAFGGFDAFVKNCYSEATVRLPQKGSEYTFFYIDKNPAHIYARNQLTLDLQTMQLLKHERYDDKTVGGKFIASMFALHSGEFFGTLGQLLMFLASLAMPLFGITGLMLYMKKRKKK